MIDNISQSGNTYTLLMYPQNVQNMILKYFVGPRPETEEQGDEDLEEVNDYKNGCVRTLFTLLTCFLVIIIIYVKILKGVDRFEN